MTTDARAELLAEPTDFDRAYWDGLAEGKLRVMHCSACNHWQPVPETFCFACGSDSMEWKDVSGSGTVHTFITVHQKYHPAFYDLVPYNVSVIELDEGPRLTANVVNIEPNDIKIGMRVKAKPAPVGDRVALFFEKE
jgi:uncharacterized protein